MSKNQLVISNEVACKINPDMVGLFFEDINFAADGGLYAELLENRSFEAVRTRGGNRNYVLREDNLYAWFSLAGGETGMEISMNSPVNEKNPHYLRFTAKAAGEGFGNKAYDGLCLKKGMTYAVSFFAREVNYLKGSIEVRVTKDGEVIAKSLVPFIVAQEQEPDGYAAMVGDCEAKIWRKYETVLTAKEDVIGAQFEICLTESGCVEFDLISMIPGDAVSGVFRKDLFEALQNLHPGFVRFPGGCIVEGTSIMRRYRWKDTVGALQDRKINTNLWGSQGGNTLTGEEIPDCHYMQSYGIGFYEYFLLCELLSSEKKVCKPLPVLNIGVACQFRSYETVPMDTPEFDEYVQDALDLIEFANGPVTSKWGALRARMGHPESFNMEFIAIGNEQWMSRHVDLFERYRRFEKAIHAVYPDIKCLGTAGPFVNHELHTGAWNYYHEEVKKNPSFTYAVDEHYYVAPQWLYDNVNFYDEYPRDVLVFAGEYAAHDANLSNSVEAGLAEAAMITGMERNGDVVNLASYAPLFNRIGHSHWTPDMIWFDEQKVVLTPSYYVQKIFSDYAGEQALVLNGQEKTLREQQLYVSLTERAGKKILKVVNAAKEAQQLDLKDEKGEAISGQAQQVLLQAASGMAKEVVETKGIDPAGPCKAVKITELTNKELCELRAPEESSFQISEIAIQGSVEIPAKSVAVFVF